MCGYRHEKVKTLEFLDKRGLISFRHKLGRLLCPSENFYASGMKHITHFIRYPDQVLPAYQLQRALRPLKRRLKAMQRNAQPSDLEPMLTEIHEKLHQIYSRIEIIAMNLKRQEEQNEASS